MVILPFLAVALGFVCRDSPPGREQARTEAAVEKKLGQELVERSARLLRSKLPREIAWGAHLAAKYELNSLAKLVVTQLPVKKALAGGHTRRYLIYTLLDAVIRLHARVPLEHLLPLAKDGFHQQVCILLAYRLANPLTVFAHRALATRRR